MQLDPPGIVEGSGWELVGYGTGGDSQRFAYAAAGKIVLLQMSLFFERTGGTINVPLNGDITDQLICTLPTELQGNVGAWQSLATGITGRVVCGAYLPTSGDVYMTAVAGAANITNGDQFSLGGLLIVEL